MSIHFSIGQFEKLSAYKGKAYTGSLTFYDEINQGMDQENERNVLDVLGQVVSSEEDCCQFFVITPKLLMGINYPYNSKVIILHNTQNPFPKKMLDTQGFIEVIKSLAAADSEEGSDENEP